MIQISLCMIVKNEEKVLERCLASVADMMDEIVIVDTGSTDRTKEIAKKYTDKIFDFKWVPSRLMSVTSWPSRKVPRCTRPMAIRPT